MSGSNMKHAKEKKTEPGKAGITHQAQSALRANILCAGTQPTTYTWLSSIYTRMAEDCYYQGERAGHGLKERVEMSMLWSAQ